MIVVKGHGSNIKLNKTTNILPKRNINQGAENAGKVRKKTKKREIN